METHTRRPRLGPEGRSTRPRPRWRWASLLLLASALVTACGTTSTSGPSNRATAAAESGPTAPPAVTPSIAAASPTPSVTPTVRVLFIGNSLTFINGLPQMFAELAQAGGFQVDVEMSAVGGWSCADHAAAAVTLDLIAAGGWDYVVLQERTNLPAIPEEREALMYPAVRQLDREIRAGGARTVLFMAWAHHEGIPQAGLPDYASAQAAVEAGYLEIAEEIDALVVPVGPAWKAAVERDRSLVLWQFDGVHATAEGTYLAACVFYAVLLGESPEGLDYTAGLPDERARALQSVAAQVVAEYAEW
jgi:hypothetical protein